MNTSAGQDQHAKAVAEQLIAETPLIDEIQQIDVELGDDFTGDPALWLIFRLAPRREASPRIDREGAQRLNDYAGVLQRKILDSDLQRFPFTRWKRAA